MEFNKNEIQKVKGTGILALILFGSQAQGTANEASDYDFFVIGKKSKETYDLLYDILSDKVNRLVDIDIVFDELAPLELKNHVSEYGQVLFEANRHVFADFRQKTMIEYSDFAPLRAVFTNATLARIG